MRIRIDLKERGLQMVAWLKSEIGVATYRELFNSAMTLLYWAIKEKKAGREIGSYAEEQDEFIELKMPWLELAAVRRDSGSEGEKMSA